jgi:hypothetical protein
MLGVPAVGGHDEARGDRPLRSAAIAYPHARHAAAVPLEAGNGLTEHEVDPVRSACQVTHHRVEALAGDVVAGRRIGVVGGWVGADPPVAAPDVDRVRHAAGCLDLVAQPQPLERRDGAREDEVVARRLVRPRIRTLLDEGHPQAGPAVERRGGGAGEAATDDHDVVVHISGDADRAAIIP